MMATPSAVARMVVRTGTAVAPRPGSRASRTPAVAGEGAPDRRSAVPIRDGRAWAGRRAERAAHHAGRAPARATRATVATAPAPSTARLAVTPRWSSAFRATPTGARGESATATATATTAAPVATASALATPSARRWPRVTPRAA